MFVAPARSLTFNRGHPYFTGTCKSALVGATIALHNKANNRFMKSLGPFIHFFRGQEERGPQVSKGKCTASNPFSFEHVYQDFEHSQLGRQLGEFSPQRICLMGKHQWSWMMRWMPAILSHRGWWVIGSFWVC